MIMKENNFDDDGNAYITFDEVKKYLFEMGM